MLRYLENNKFEYHTRQGSIILTQDEINDICTSSDIIKDMNSDIEYYKQEIIDLKYREESLEDEIRNLEDELADAYKSLEDN